VGMLQIKSFEPVLAWLSYYK